MNLYQVITPSPTKEVWSEGMFLHLLVCPQRVGLCMMSLPVRLPGFMFLPGGVYVQGALSGGSLSRGSLPERGFLTRGISVKRLLIQKSGRYTSYWNAPLFLI